MLDISLSRALLVNPSILLLDEATSALDNASQKVVQQAIDEVLSRRKKTTLIIAHRLSTVYNADKIVVLRNDGSGAKVVEEGTHEQLTAKHNGVYRRLFELQSTPVANTSDSQSSSWWSRIWSGNDPSRLTQAPERTEATSPPSHCAVSKDVSKRASQGQMRRLAAWARGEAKWYVFGTIGSAMKGSTQPVLSIIMSALLVRYVLIPLPYSGFPVPCVTSSTCTAQDLCKPLHLPEGFPSGSICVKPCHKMSDCRVGDSCSDFSDLGFLDGSYCSSGYVSKQGTTRQSIVTCS